MIRYDKLVRNRIPEIIARDSKQCTVGVLETDEYVARLRDKLGEELAEFQAGGSVEELVDLVEVARAQVEQQRLAWEEFEGRREGKRQARDGFSQRLLLETVWEDGEETLREGAGDV